MNLLFFSGSFHSSSKSLALIKAIAAMLPEHHCTVPRLDELPYFCEDLNRDKPQRVRELLAQVEAADALITVSPEYNHSIPAVLKNALDWASRPAFASPLKGKPVTFVTQGESPVGGARAQAHLKLVLDATLSRIYPSHEMLIGAVQTALNAERELVDAAVQRRLQRHLEEFLAFAGEAKR